MSIFSNFSNNPVTELKIWYDLAKLHYEASNNLALFDQATLCTVGSDNQPSGRIILVKSIKDDGPVFYTNYESRKGLELEKNPKVALVIHWGLLGRQVRVEGSAEKLSTEESELYYHTRPRLSQIGAHASKQSSKLNNKQDLIDSVKKLETDFQDIVIPKPANWGGYVIRPHRLEFWLDGEFRLHDRLVYEKYDGKWNKHLLYP